MRRERGRSGTSRRPPRYLVGTLGALLFVACPASTPAERPDVPADALVHPETDAGDVAENPSTALCPSRSYRSREVRADDGRLPDAPFVGEATDFSLLAFRGPLSLSDLTDGCEPVVIFIHIPGMNDGLFSTSASSLAIAGMSKTHYLFVSDAPDDLEREAVITAAVESVDRSLRALAPDQAAREVLRERFHFGLTRASEIEGSLGAHVRAFHDVSRDPARGIVDLGERGRIPMPPPSVVGIDPGLQWDPGGSLAPWVGAADELSMGAWLGEWLAWRAEVELGEGSELVGVVLHDASITARSLVLDVPDLAVARGDALELLVEVRCDEVHPLACSEWDRLARVSVCASAAADCLDRVEIARWITPYWRRGRQVYRMAVQHATPLLSARGARLHVELGPEWERPTPWHVVVSLLSRAGDEPAPASVELVLVGGAFDHTYAREVTFQTRPGMSRAELWVLVSGHGQTDGDNCAEWCDHRHRFELNGHEAMVVAHAGAPIGSATGCAERARHGVMPLQWGNWAPQRAYWCPGEEVPWHRTPLDGLLAPAGADNRLLLTGTLGEAGAPAGGDIALTALVVWYE